jgi:hypothetical protein
MSINALVVNHEKEIEPGSLFPDLRSDDGPFQGHVLFMGRVYHDEKLIMFYHVTAPIDYLRSKPEFLNK